MKKIENILGLAGFFMVLAALVWYSINNIWQAAHWVLSLAGLLAIGYYLFIYIRANRSIISGRSVRQGGNLLVQVIVVLAIVSLLAFVSTRHHFRRDFTANKLYSLADQTTKLLAGLGQEVTIKAFYKKSEHKGVQDLLDEYAYRSKNFRYELIDPDENPGVTGQYGVTRYQTVIVEAGLRRQELESLSESNLTNALLKVTREQEKAVYFLTGHGERSLKDESAEGYSQLSAAIGKENYLVRELNLVRRRQVPDSCTVLVIAAPQVNLFPGEIDSLRSFLQKNGKLIVLSDPDKPRDINELLREYQLEIGANLIIDASGMGQLFGAGPAMPIVSTYDSSSPVTKDFNTMTFYPMASSVDKSEGPASVSELLQTGRSSWAETNYASGEVGFDPGERQGPITIGAISEKNNDNGKSLLAVFGDSDFIKNGFFENQGNADLFLNTINYLAEEEDQISIRPKELDDRRLNMSEAGMKILFYLVVITLPLLLIVIGLLVFFRRNR